MKEKYVLDALESSLSQHGFVGDTRPAKLAYLTLISTLLPEPVSLLIKGPSGSGKSFALSCGKRYVPEDAYEEFHGMSEKAIVYMGEKLNLKHRALIIQEAAGLRDGPGRAFIRQLLTEGEIRYATVQSTKDGLEGKELPKVEGPCGLLMTTTAGTLHPEDESRMLSCQIDESPERLREALIAKAIGKVTKPSEDELKPWHDLYRAVVYEVQERNRSVVVPFGGAIAERVPTSHFRIARDLAKVVTLIQTHALLRYCSGAREVDADGNVIATLEDYSVVRNLVEPILAHSLEVAVPNHIREVVEAVLEFAKRANPRKDSMPWEDFHGVSQRELADHLGRDMSVISRNVRRGIEGDYLIDKNPGQGKVSEIVLGKRDLPSGQVLPLPDKLGQPVADTGPTHRDEPPTGGNDDESEPFGTLVKIDLPF